MKTWNIGNTTVRNPERLREALQLFVSTFSGRPFTKAEQREFQRAMIYAGLVNSERLDGDDGGRKFGSAFKQLGFVTDWSDGKKWTVTSVGKSLIEHPELEESIFLRQLLKYQIASPLESGTKDFALRPFRVLLRFLKRAHDAGLVGLTKFEIGLFVITITTEDSDEFEAAFTNIRQFREEYNSIKGNVKKKEFGFSRAREIGQAMGLKSGTFLDYADSNSRYSLMSGLLTLRGSRVAVSEAKLPYINEILNDGSTLIPDADYLALFYDPEFPKLPTDNYDFLSQETAQLLQMLTALAAEVNEPYDLPRVHPTMTLFELQVYEVKLRKELARLKEIRFYRTQSSKEAIGEIHELLQDIKDGTLFGGEAYAPAYFEWCIWRLFLSLNQLVGPVHKTRGFKIDEDMQPIHHAQGGAADLTFTYKDFKIVCEMTLASGSRQFAMEGEPVTRHVFKAIQESSGTPVYGLFVAKKLDPNTADAFHLARYWQNWTTEVLTPVVALEIDHILALVDRMRLQQTDITDIRKLLDEILALQPQHQNGPSWYSAYKVLYDHWSGTNPFSI